MSDRPGRPGLLSGVRVLSFGTFVAGQHRGHASWPISGPRSSRSRPRSRPEVLRMPAYAIGEAATEPSGVPNTVMQASLTRGLRNVSLDLADEATPDGVPPPGRRLRRGDRELRVSRSRALGLRVSTDLLAHKPDLVMLSLSGYGRDGPRANYLAYGVTVASYLGLGLGVGLRPWHADGLRRRRHGGVGDGGRVGRGAARRHPAYLDVAQSRCRAAAAGRAVRARRSTRARHPSGTLEPSRRGHGCRGVFPSRGHDQWLAVDIEDGSDWETSSAVALDRPDLQATDPERRRALEHRCRRRWANGLSRCSAHIGNAPSAAGRARCRRSCRTWRTSGGTRNCGPEGSWTRCGSRISGTSPTRGPPSAGAKSPGRVAGAAGPAGRAHPGRPAAVARRHETTSSNPGGRRSHLLGRLTRSQVRPRSAAGLRNGDRPVARHATR